MLIQTINVNDIEFTDTILIMIYTGFRVGELLDLKTENIKLEEGIMIGGLKTEAGKDRIIPIHNKILPLIKNLYNPKNEFFIINSKGQQMKYSNYRREKFDVVMKKLGMNHSPHECRHTFATLMSNADANSVAITKIMGHENYGLTKKVYTHKDVEELKKAVDSIKI